MKRLFSYNAISRFFFLMLTPVFFRYFAIGFVWHSIYWGVITAVVLIWMGFILITPLFGRIGCGWFCFMGTAYDFASTHAIRQTKWNKPKIWVRSLILVPFFFSAGSFYFINLQRGITHGFAIIPSFLTPDFNTHYKIAWMVDISFAIIFGLLLDRRWGCRNLCYMGALCAMGAKHSRLIPVVDLEKCTNCGKCERNCLLRIPMLEYIKNNQGLITNSECILCGKCIEVCKPGAVTLKMVWNRKKYKSRLRDSQAPSHELPPVSSEPCEMALPKGMKPKRAK